MIKKILLPIVILIITFGCKEDDNITPNPDILLNNNETKITGFVDIPDNISTDNIKIVTTSSDYAVNSDGTFSAALNELEKQFIFAEDQDGNILYMSLHEGKDNLNASSTARAMIAMLPWTAYVEPTALPSILDEAANIDGYTALVIAIENSVKNNISPFDDDDVIQLVKGINEKITGEGASNLRITELPEVDKIVEPQITLSNGIMTIKNDGTTTSAWGVNVSLDGESLTGNLVLPGNKVSFLTLSDILSFLSDEYTSSFYEAGKPLEIPLSREGKYEVEFESPTSLNLFESDLAIEAAYYNIATSHEAIFKAFGLEFKNIHDIVAHGQGCAGDAVKSVSEVILNTMQGKKIDAKFFINQIVKLINGNAKSLSECADMFTNFQGSKITVRERYLKNFVKFLNFYGKAELTFTLSKLFADMTVLSDIKVSRQILTTDLYPSFTLVWKSEYDNINASLDENVLLKVGTELDLPGTELTFPAGAPVFWEIVEGDGTLQSSKTYVGFQDGIAEVFYKVGEAEKHIIKASIKDKNGNDIESVLYNVTAVDPCLDNNAPIISNPRITCVNENSVILIDFISAAGSNIADGFGSCDVNANNCYPTRVHFKSDGATEFSVAANSYDATIKSGNEFEGTIEIIIHGTCNESTSISDFWEWQIQQIDKCGKRSNIISL